jgi:hypothetical protein
MNRLIKTSASFFILLLSSSELLPPNPQKGFQRKRVRTLLKNYEIEDSGNYLFYWDGKNDSGQFVQRGFYRVVLNNAENKEYFFEVLDGGVPGKNDHSQFELKEVYQTKIVSVSPNHCQVKSGANIKVDFFGNGLILLEIFFDRGPD